MKVIVFSRHSLEQMPDRGATRQEVEQTIYTGEKILAKKGRIAFRKNFPFQKEWKGRHYEIKQVMPIIVEENDKIIVVTVYVFFWGGKT